MRYSKWFRWCQTHLDNFLIIGTIVLLAVINASVLITLSNTNRLITLIVVSLITLLVFGGVFAYLVYALTHEKQIKRRKPLKVIYLNKTLNGAPIIKSNKKKSYYVWKVISYSVLIIYSAIIIAPFLIAVITSITPLESLKTNGFKFNTGVIDLTEYIFVLTPNENGNIYSSLINTLSYILPPVVVGTFFSALAAYAFARIDFKGKNVAFFLMLATMVIPGIIFTFPSYMLFTEIYKTPQWWKAFPIVVPGMFGAVGTMFFLKQYFATLPRDLEEAAEMDGMGRFGMFLKIILPLSVPALITQLLLGFNGCYNDYLGPLLYVGDDPKTYTIQIFIQGLSTARNLNEVRLMAGSIVGLIPTLILYLAGQKFFVEGIVMTGIK